MSRIARDFVNFAMNVSSIRLPRSLFVTLATGSVLLAGAACVGAPEDEEMEMEMVESAESALYAGASHSTLARAVRPRFNHGNTECFPLTFQEISPTASASERDGLKSKCKSSYDPNFVVFASVKRAGSSGLAYASNWNDESFRATYGVAYGQQNTSLNDIYASIYGLFGDVGTHGEDKQYLVADVVNGAFTSAWADVHKGNYVRVKPHLTMYNGDHVTVWPGKNYHALNLVTDRTTVCDGEADWRVETLCEQIGKCVLTSTCSGLDEAVMNFGDPVGSNHQGDGKLVMVDDVCSTTGTSYTSPDSITYSGTQLDALKAFIGCDNAQGVWSGNFKSQQAYSAPYSLMGCDSGDTAGGDICNGSTFGSTQAWRTFSGSARYLEPDVVGSADVDYSAGSFFNDMLSAFKAPASITIRTGSRVDAVSVTYTDGLVRSHGGTSGSAHTISGLETDPVVSVSMCEGSKDGKARAGHIKLTTLSGRTLSGGSGSSSCRTVAPANKALYGFYGRSGGEIDVLGTYWASR